jgi:hypothetical protein
VFLQRQIFCDLSNCELCLCEGKKKLVVLNVLFCLLNLMVVLQVYQLFGLQLQLFLFLH